MAWRDAKASRVRLLLFMASIILGIAAVVSIQLFSKNLENNIQLQSKVLMGADFIIDSQQIPTDRAQAIIDSLEPDASEVNFVSMIAFPKNGGTKLANVLGLEGGFPFYGIIDSQPVSAATNYQKLTRLRLNSVVLAMRFFFNLVLTVSAKIALYVTQNQYYFFKKIAFNF
ncbi:MAG: putative ABC transport system permease protein [Glaciecola sp.]|jgi:putative ABC transport system permease protein